MQDKKVFILTGEWQDVRGKNLLKFFGVSEDSKPVEIRITNNPVFFIRRTDQIDDLKIPFQRKEVELKNFSGEDVDAIYFNTESDLRKAAEELHTSGLKTFESDIDPGRRYLMERFINAQVLVSGKSEIKNGITIFPNPKIENCEFTPDLKIASIDIETGAKNGLLYSVAVHFTFKDEEFKKVFLLDEDETKLPGYISSFQNEKDLLLAFFKWFNELDPDIIIGWHVIGFDLMFLENKCKEFFIPFDIARANGRVSLRTRKPRGYFASVTGRIVIDGPHALRTSFFTFEDYKLDSVAKELLGEGKAIDAEKDKVEEIDRMFNEDKESLAEYNLKDAELVTQIFRKANLIELYIRRSQISGMLMDELGMMTAAFDHFFLPRLHRAGYVAPNKSDIEETEHSAGGYVLDPIPGIYYSDI